MPRRKLLLTPPARNREASRMRSADRSKWKVTALVLQRNGWHHSTSLPFRVKKSQFLVEEQNGRYGT
jgi:hypothetical protein